jgi:hypothetical protein
MTFAWWIFSREKAKIISRQLMVFIPTIKVFVWMICCIVLVFKKGIDKYKIHQRSNKKEYLNNNMSYHFVFSRIVNIYFLLDFWIFLLPIHIRIFLIWIVVDLQVSLVCVLSINFFGMYIILIWLINKNIIRKRECILDSYFPLASVEFFFSSSLHITYDDRWSKTKEHWWVAFDKRL